MIGHSKLSTKPHTVAEAKYLLLLTAHSLPSIAVLLGLNLGCKAEDNEVQY